MQVTTIPVSCRNSSLRGKSPVWSDDPAPEDQNSDDELAETNSEAEDDEDNDSLLGFSLVPLLLHDPDVPASARAALRQATLASPTRRRDWLEAAAFALTREAHLDGDDARALVGLYD